MRDFETPRGVRPGIFEEQPLRPKRVRGFWFNRDRHPDTETDGPRVVPRWDTLRYDRVASLRDPPLEVAPDWKEAVFGDGPAWSTSVLIATIAAAGYVAAELARLASPYLAHPWASVLWFALLLGVPIWALREGATFRVSLLLVALVPISFVVVLLLGAAQAAHRLAAELVALGIGAFFVDRFADHAVQIAIARGALPPERRLALRESWARRWRALGAKGRPDALKAERQARRQVGVYPLGFLFFGLLMPFAEGPSAHHTLALVSIAGGLVLALRGLLRPGFRRLVIVLGEAVASFVHYGRRGSFAPGVLRSPAGERIYRLGLLGLTCIVLAGTFVPSLVEFQQAIMAAERGPTGAGAFIGSWLLLSAALPLAMLLGGILAVAVPVLGAVSAATDGCDDERTAAIWAFVVHMLRTSADPVHRRQVLWGFHATSHYAVLIPIRAVHEHVYIAGGAGGGNTSRALVPICRQVIALQDEDRGAVLIVDFKGDEYLFQSSREAAAKAGRRFRFFTNRVGYPSHAWNPLLDLRASGLPLIQATGPLRAGLNLEQQGTGHGRQAHFTAVSRGLLRELFKRFPDVRSLHELQAEMTRTRPILSAAHKRREEQAYEFLLNLELLSESPELNVTSGSAFDERIDMSRAVLEDEVLYFFLSAKPEESVARFIGRLAVETFFDALARYNHTRDETGQKVNVFKHAYGVLDEFVAGRNFETFMEVARGNGLGLVLASQVPAKLPRELRMVIEENVAVRHYFTTRGASNLRDLLQLGGTTIETGLPDHSGASRFEEAPRLSENVLKVVSAQEDLSVVVVQKSVDFAQFDGFPVVMRAPHADSRAAHAELIARAWPVGDELLIVGDAIASQPDERPRVVPLRTREATGGTSAPSASPSPASGEPTKDTELVAFFSQIVVTEDGYAIAPGERGEAGEAGKA